MASLLPAAKTHFDDLNGRPLAGGKVYFYQVGTETKRDTYQDRALSIPNANPIILDARGEATIWGTGSYRQVLTDSADNQIWDQIVEDANANLTGNMTNARWIAGASYSNPSGSTPGTFVPGTTVAFTLPVSPGSITNLWPFFDASFQADDQIASLSGSVLTFTSPVPVGIQEVEIKIGSTIAIGTPAAGTVDDTAIAQNSRVWHRTHDVVFVTDYGADPTGAAYCDQAFAAALAAGNLVFVPPGTYKIQHTITLPRAKSRLVGAGIGTTTITCDASPTEDMITCADFIIDVGVHRMLLQKNTVTPSAGFGVNFTKSISRGTIEDVIVTGCFKGIGLGVTDFGKVIRATAQLNYDDGFYVTNSSINSTCQWTLEDCLSSTNGGNGLLIASQPSSTPGMMVGENINFSTFGNTKRGIAVLGSASNPINGIRIMGGFIGGDGDDEIIFDSHAGGHKIIGTYIELPGTSPTGPNGTPASHIGNGINLLTGNIDVQIVGVKVNGAQYNGIATAAMRTTIIGCVASNNALANISGGVSGIINTGTGTMTVTGGASYGQPIGVYSNDGSLTSVTGVDLSGNTAGAYDALTNKTQMQVTGCLPFGTKNP